MVDKINEVFDKLIDLAIKNSQEMPIAACLIKVEDFFNHRLDRGVWATNQYLVHAEMVVAAGYWDLKGYILFSTLEPCPSCLWYLVDKKVTYIIYGAPNDIYKVNSRHMLSSLNISIKTSFFYGFREEAIKLLFGRFFKRDDIINS